MKHQVAERQTELRGQTESSSRRDAFTMLVEANESESGKYRLDEEELVCHLIDRVLLFLTVQKDRQCFYLTFRWAWYLIPHIMLIPTVQHLFSKKLLPLH